MSLLKRIEKSYQGDRPTTSALPTQPNASPSLLSALPVEGASSRLAEIGLKRQAAVAPTRDTTRDLKDKIHTKLIAELDPKLDVTKTDEVRASIEQLFNSILAELGVPLNKAERAKLFEELVADILGFGPIQQLLNDATISEIMINGPKSIYIERGGKLVKTPINFEDEDHLRRIVQRIVSPIGRRVDESTPYVDARLPDGSRVNIVIPPLAIKGSTVTIRKFSRKPLTADILIQNGSLSIGAVALLKACSYARMNVLVSGGTGTGKTTFLNMLSSFIPEDERIITIENAAELQLQQDHVVTLESRPPNIEGKGEVTIRDLVINALRMRPERIIVGECRGGEAFEMLQAMNTGHDGSMSTLHANTPRDALARLESMCLMSGMDLPVRAIREQIASAIDMIVQLERMRDGSRRTVNISEVQGMEGDVIVMQDIFKFEQQGIDEKTGRIIGSLSPTGVRPKFMDKLEAAGQYLPPEVFGVDQRRRR